MIIFDELKKKAKDYGVPFWKLPDVLLIFSAILNIVAVITTYYWASSITNDPRVASLLVIIEALIILVVTSIIIDSVEKVISSQKMKKDFIDTISHQIGTPITNIRWSVEMLERKKGVCNSACDVYLKRIVDSSLRIVTIFNDFINLSKLDEQKILQKRKFNLPNLVKEIISLNQTFAKGKDLKIVFSCPKNISDIKSNKEGLGVVLENLIDNAVKYSNEKSQIKISLKKEESNFLFEISNKGKGIDDDEKKFIFSKFFRSRNARKVFPQGTGLGLYVSKNILEKIGGKIWFEKISGGMKFFVKLPIK